ncbi:hypothetical protein VTJ49DRAFT_5081 [Mycothermus thermophilus]|uniref:4'-phosphopantetheinyl transferase domain-containing protein n=1 Tax=Humicola insolens TaxID=85995 RepID=A0ABR3V3X4_HUMIN
MPPPLRAPLGAPFPIPFPLPLRIGTDICRVPRIAQILRRPPKEPGRFVRRVLAAPEVAFAPPVVRMMWQQGGGPPGKDDGGTTSWRGWGAIRTGEPGKGEGEGEGEGRVKEEVKKGLEAAERQDGGKLKDSVEFRRAVEFVAGRFAAKEAAFKAHPHLHLGFHDVLILAAGDAQSMFGKERWPPLTNSRTGNAPVAIIRDGDKGRIQVAQISISHDWGYATAVCMGFDADSAGSIGQLSGGETGRE